MDSTLACGWTVSLCHNKVCIKFLLVLGIPWGILRHPQLHDKPCKLPEGCSWSGHRPYAIVVKNHVHNPLKIEIIDH